MTTPPNNQPNGPQQPIEPTAPRTSNVPPPGPDVLWPMAPPPGWWENNIMRADGKMPVRRRRTSGARFVIHLVTPVAWILLGVALGELLWQVILPLVHVR